MYILEMFHRHVYNAELTQVILDVPRAPVLPLEVHQLVVLALLDRDLALPLVRRHQVGGRVQVHLARLEGDEGLGAGLAHPAAAEEGAADCHGELREATKEDFLPEFMTEICEMWES